MKESKPLDLIIIGAGPAGLAASIYASRYGIRHLVIGQILGGQISETHLIDNYPGIEDASGFDFSQKWGHHAQKYGVKIIPNLVGSIKKEKELFKIELENNVSYQAKTVLLATGTKRRQLNIPGEKEFAGHGVSYCATCDGFFYKNKTVAVIGGGDGAVGAAIYLAEISQKVYLVYRGQVLRAEPFWIKLAEKNKKIDIICGTNAIEIIGNDKVTGLKLDQNYQNSQQLAIDGVFIEAGSDPGISYAENLDLEADEQDYIKIKKDSSTSVSGIWAAGDITNGSDKFRQVITAASEGAIAARSIFNWLKGK